MTLGLVVLTESGVALAVDSREMCGARVVRDDATKLFQVVPHVAGLHSGAVPGTHDLQQDIQESAEHAISTADFHAFAATFFGGLSKHWQPVLKKSDCSTFLIGAYWPGEGSVAAVCHIQAKRSSFDIYPAPEPHMADYMCIGEHDLASKFIDAAQLFDKVPSLDDTALRCVFTLRSVAGILQIRGSTPTIGGRATVAVIPAWREPSHGEANGIQMRDDLSDWITSPHA